MLTRWDLWFRTEVGAPWDSPLQLVVSPLPTPDSSCMCKVNFDSELRSPQCG
jgi:hypothetical protein